MRRSLVLALLLPAAAHSLLTSHRPPLTTRALPRLPLRCATPSVSEQAIAGDDAAPPPAAGTGGDSVEADNREIVAIALPAVASALIDPILSLIDTMWVSAIRSRYALGAVAAATELFTMAFAASLALRESSSSTIARLSAAGRGRDAAQFSRRSVQVGVAAGVVVGALLASPRTAPFCVGLMGAHSGVRGAASLTQPPGRSLPPPPCR